MKSINLIIKLDLQWIKNFFIISSTEVEVFEKSSLDISDNTDKLYIVEASIPSHFC